MKILIVSELFYPKLRGGEVVLWRVAQGLAARGHSVRVLTARLEETEPRESVNGVEIIRPCEIGAEGKSQTMGAIGEKLSFMRRIYPHIRREIKDLRPEVIYDNAYTATLPAGLAGKRSGLPVVTNIGNLQGLGHFDGGVNPLVGSIQGLKEYLFIRFGGHRAIRVASEAVGERVRKITGARVFTIPTPIDDSLARETLASADEEKIRAELGVEEGELFLLYVGALERVKNLDSLIEVLGRLSRPFRFAVVGEGRERPLLERVARNVGIGEKLKFLGRLNHERVLELMKGADAFLLSSKSETGPLVVLEALSVNTPVISTDVGMVGEIESDNLTVVEDVEEIREALEVGPKRHKDQSIIERYSVDKITAEFERMFEIVIDDYG